MGLISVTPSSLYIPSPEGARAAWLHYLGGIALFTLFYSLLSLLAYLSLAALNDNRPPPMVDVITGLKILSLLMLGFVGAREMMKAPDAPTYLIWANLALLALIFVSVIVLLFKLVVGPETESAAVQWCHNHANLFSVLPLVMYGVVNMGSALVGWAWGIRTDYSFKSAIFLAVSDIPCLLPLLAIWTTTGMLERAAVISSHDASLLWGGSMAMFVYISALLAVTAGFIIRRVCVRTEVAVPT